jgi:hypothetical protein
VAFEDRSLYTLGEAGRSKQDPHHELPSWVADWAHPVPHLSLSILGEGSKFRREDPLRVEAMSPLYYAGGDLIIGIGPEQLFPLSGIMAIQTKTIGRITSQTEHPGMALKAENGTELDISLARRRLGAYQACVSLATSSLSTIGAHDTPASITACVNSAIIAGLNGYDSKEPWDISEYFPCWLSKVTREESTTVPVETQMEDENSSLYSRAVERALGLAHNSGLAHFAMLDYQFFGLVPAISQNGDEVVIISGAPVAFVVRRMECQQGKPAYELIGEAYVHGVMDGELMANQEVLWNDMWLV